MVKINFQEPDTEEWKKWREKCEQETRKLIEAAKEGRTPSEMITDLYKEKAIKRTIYMSDDGPFHGKCAYCESPISHDQYGDIEHFRPAKEVSDIDFNPVMVDGPAGTGKHPGYYWLAYDSNNLLASCELCNRKNPNDKKIGKHTRFPVKGTHAAAPGEEFNEQPLLINPLIEEPEEHFEIDGKTGILGYKTERGKTCRDIFGLNERDGLRKGRKTAYTNALGILAKLMLSTDESADSECFRELCDIMDGKSAYAFAGRKAIKGKMDFWESLSRYCLRDNPE